MAGVSVVIPVYNSEDTLVELVTRLGDVLCAAVSQYEVILVNDGSHDGSWQQIESICARHESVRGIDLMRNYGQHNALLLGIREAQYETIVTIDDDLQHPPEEIPILLGTLEEGYDVVYGVPQAAGHSLWRNLSSDLTKLALRRVLGASTAQDVSAFRAFRTEGRKAFAHYQSPFVNLDVLLSWGLTRFVSVPVRHEPRMFGDSNYTFAKLVTHALNMITGFSTLPLEIISAIGVVLALLGSGVLLISIVSWLVQGADMPKIWALAAIITVLSGIQLFVLGFLGVYLARVHLRIMGRPVYAVRREIGAAQE